jgi:hypothetical protein
MPSLKSDFDELIVQIRHGRDFAHASFDPVYYLVFSPEQILEAKRSLPAWIARLSNEGWQPHTFSMAEHVLDLLGSSVPRKIWLMADQKNPGAWKKTNAALANSLSQGALQNRIIAEIERLQEQQDSLLLITDIEALHPYMRIGTIESQLYGKFSIPTVFLYPGKRTGKTRLSFLGFYPEDGNYRSVHVGG